MRLLIVTALIAGCAHDAPGPAGSTAALEARIKKLEADNAKHAEALDFLDKVYAQQKQQADAREGEEPAEDATFAVDIAADVKAGQVDGPATASVTIIKVFDFACPYCARMSPTLESVVQKNSGKVRVVYKNLIVHEPARPAHLASCAAAKQGKYLAFKHAFWDDGFQPYANSSGKDAASLGEDNIVKIATKLGLDVPRFKKDMASDGCKAAIAADMSELEKFRVNATPTLFVNGTEVAGAIPEDALQQLVDEKLAAVQKSGVAPAEYYDKVVMAGEKKFRSKKDPKPH
ncbi:MAG TPA: thioredoxin domain-containing protein [Kofleriaceae bacterium]|nr:thioredoxin domain-containing protein [Kofleriaceae bacterium]